MSTDTYRQILIQVQQLTIDEQFQLMEDLLAMLRSQIVHKPLHSLLELEGLGEENWIGVDVRAYIDQERDSW